MDDEDVTLEEISDEVVVGYNEDGEPIFVMTTRADHKAVLEEAEDENGVEFDGPLVWEEVDVSDISDEPDFDLVRAWFADEKTVWAAR